MISSYLTLQATKNECCFCCFLTMCHADSAWMCSYSVCVSPAFVMDTSKTFKAILW